MPNPLPTLPKGWKVKNLEWREVYEDPSEFSPKVIGWKAESILGRYEIWIKGKRRYWTYRETSVHAEIIDETATAIQAKDVAQSDFESRILSALVQEK